MKEYSDPFVELSDKPLHSSAPCKILPFRRPAAPMYGNDDELVYELVAVESTDKRFAEENGRFLKAYPDELPRAALCHGWTLEVEEPPASTYGAVPRWVKKALLVSTFTAWTIVAIAISIALG